MSGINKNDTCGISSTPPSTTSDGIDQKRQRTGEYNSCIGSQLKEFHEAISWIRSNEGFIHEALTLLNSNRDENNHSQQLNLNEKTIRGEITSKDDIKKGALLMKIPRVCLISLNSAKKTMIGKFVLNVINTIDDTKVNWYHSKGDLALASYLAILTMSTKSDDQAERSSSLTDTVKAEIGFHSPYIQTLPDKTSYDNLPRRWKDEDLDRILGGTSLLSKVKEDKRGVNEDYKTLSRLLRNKSSLENVDESFTCPCPSLELFDTCLAAVSSRAFSGFGGAIDDDIDVRNSFGGEDSDAMVPILDLLNHKRGIQQTPEVTYKCIDGDIIVKARQDIKKGTTLQDTYGAKGNAQLFSRYGFCLSGNLEPDGSSNDVLELDLPLLLSMTDPNATNPDKTYDSIEKINKTSKVNLRAGPKSYTYGGFVMALEMCRSNETTRESSNVLHDDEENDMEAFLNECEGEEEGEDDFYGDEKFDGMYEDADQDDENDDSLYCSVPASSSKEINDSGPLEAEYKALCAFASALIKATSLYSIDLHKSSTACGKEKYAAILISSEKRTISFYLKVIELILSDLEKEIRDDLSIKNPMKTKKDIISSTCGKSLAQEDEEMLSNQCFELRNVYFKIRHPEIFCRLQQYKL